jgi:taurine--2-oxoglutarate transaminase
MVHYYLFATGCERVLCAMRGFKFDEEERKYRIHVTSILIVSLTLPSLHNHFNHHPQPSPNNEPILVDKAHFQPLGTWTADKVNESRASNPYMMTWVPGKARDAVPYMTHGEGVYLFDSNGKRYLDWTSQAVCANLGHDIPEAVVEAAAFQMRELPFVYGGIGITEVRARINQLMSEILPGDLRAAVFPSSGAEANEAGIMMARRFTGKQKILSWYRSYHGATGAAGAATGDFRRWYGSDEVPGFVKAFNPFPLFFDHAGENEAEQVDSALRMLEEQILNEGPQNIASIMMESVVGAGGVLVMPDGYMQGVRGLCDEYGILMHCDEVMVGFGRTGEMFGFQNYEGVVPDIITAAKGISSAAIPLSMTACSQEIMEFFDDKPLGYGSTYQAHPVALACAYENIKFLLQNDVVGRVQQMAPLFEANMQRLAENHHSIKQYRSIGLFGCLDVKEIRGSNPKLQHEAAHEAFMKYKKAYADNGLVGLHRYPHVHCAPPLSITEDELLDGFDRLDRSLDVLDDALGYHDDSDSAVSC